MATVRGSYSIECIRYNQDNLFPTASILNYYSFRGPLQSDGDSDGGGGSCVGGGWRELYEDEGRVGAGWVGTRSSP